MAQDCFVSFKDRKPTKEELQLVLEDYLRDLALEVKWDRDRFFVRLPGMKTNPFRRIAKPYEEEDERWFEVIPDLDDEDPTIDVLTRRQDEITNNIAHGFARLVARYWGGELDEDHR